MRRWLGIVIGFGIFLFLPAPALYGAATELTEARTALGSLQDPGSQVTLQAARGHLRRAEDALSNPVVKTYSWLPFVGHNIRAAQATASEASAVLETSLRLRGLVDPDRLNLLSGGRIDVSRLIALRPALDAQIDSLERFRAVTEDHRSGWLVPPLWDALEDMQARVTDLLTLARPARELLATVPALLGAEKPRTYLVMSVNNAELRGAGGLLSAVGTVSVEDGRIRLGPMVAREQLVTKPYRSVAAPSDYLERYGAFKPNTTLWANVTYSPDFFDDARVAARLYKKVAGIRTDGALMVDPRGLAAMLPMDASIAVPGRDEPLPAGELPGWIYSDAYAEFASDGRRRAAILQVAREALKTALQEGLSPGALDRTAAAFSGGHLRFVSFQRSENGALDALGVTGRLRSITADHVQIAAHNMGDGRREGTKLDHWIDRDVRHACDLHPDGPASCSVQVRFTNRTPSGLSRYVAGRPYGLLRSYVEVLIPRIADIISVRTVDGPAEVRPYVTGRFRSLAVYVEIPRHGTETITVDYELPIPASDYSIAAVPQPITKDATLRLALRVPAGFVIEGPDQAAEGEFHYEGNFDHTIRVSVSPEGKTGIPGLWEGITRFWNEPLF